METKQASKQASKEGREGGREGGRKEGRKEGRKQQAPQSNKKHKRRTQNFKKNTINSKHKLTLKRIDKSGRSISTPEHGVMSEGTDPVNLF